MQGQKGSMALF